MSAGPRALIVVDMLNDFCRQGAPLYVPSTGAVIPNIKRELERARLAGDTVIFVCDAHAPDDPEFANWPAHAVAGSEGAQVIGELTPGPGEHIVHKTTLLGFYRTSLEEILSREGVRDITLTGCVTNICIMLIAHEAAVRGYRVRVPRNCVAGLDPVMHEFALRQMKEVINVEII